MLQVPGGGWIHSRSVLALFMRRIHVLKMSNRSLFNVPNTAEIDRRVLCCGDSWALCLLRDETMYLYIEQQPFLRAKHCRNKSPCSQTLTEFSQSETDGRPSLSSKASCSPIWCRIHDLPILIPLPYLTWKGIRLEMGPASKTAWQNSTNRCSGSNG